jgi:YD repeat-containing protein
VTVRGNGTASSWDYDDASRLTSLTHNAAGTDNDLTVTFGYNPAGQIVTRTASNPGSGPGQADAFAFTGHAAGSVTDTHNGLNQVATSGGTPVDHSQRGTVIEIGASGYNYNAENQMTSTSTGVTLGYDALGRLYQVSEGGNVRRFVHDGHSIIGENDGAGNYLHRRGAPSACNTVAALLGAPATLRGSASRRTYFLV